MNRPVTTLFMLVSVDGKISTGATDALDFDRDFPKINGLKEGLQQYYDIEQTTDLWSMNSGRVMAKMGVNDGPMPPKTPVSFVILDNSHLTEHGVRHFCARSDRFVLVTSNANHPAFDVTAENLSIIYQNPLNLASVFEKLRTDFGCESLTVQTGGTLNGIFLREKLFDYVDFVVAPVLVGGSETVGVVDGPSLVAPSELGQLGVLELVSAEVLKNSYLRFRYKVIS